MKFEGKNIGLAITGSFCTFEDMIPVIEELVNLKAHVVPIFSYNAANIDTRFGKAEAWIERIENITGNKSILTIPDAEPIGPQGLFDVVLIAPCTGNSLAKLANAITDTPVIMAAKSQLRNERPVVISISTNDGLSMNAKNLGVLLNVRNVYFVPFGQDNPMKKANSLIANIDSVIPTIEKALEKKQIQPLLV